MGTGIELFARLKDELGQRPVTLNVIFAFLLAGVEKMLEVDFACPCNPTWNAVFVAPFFLIPAVTASFLMLLIRASMKQTESPNARKTKLIKTTLCCLLPQIVWLALMLLNGQYMVCAKTNWQGTFMSSDNTYLKWCEPINVTVQTSKELLTLSHRFYILSQVRIFFVLFLLQILFC